MDWLYWDREAEWTGISGAERPSTLVILCFENEQAEKKKLEQLGSLRCDQAQGGGLAWSLSLSAGSMITSPFTTTWLGWLKDKLKEVPLQSPPSSDRHTRETPLTSWLDGYAICSTAHV